MTKSNSVKLVELYPAMFTWGERGYKHNVFESTYNKALAFVHKHIKFTRSIPYIKQSNPYDYGFDINDGWYALVYQLILKIRNNDQAKGKWVTKVTQCKEKFGGLRFYVTGTSDKNWDLIREAEKKSFGICEVTGSEVEVGIWNDGWVQTLSRKEALSRFAKLSDEGKLKDGKTFNDYWAPREASVTIETPKKKKKIMSLAQRELGETFKIGYKNNQISMKHIEVIRFDASKIAIREYLNGSVLPTTPTYQPAIIKMIGARLLVVNPDNGEEYYDCRYEDCTIKRING